MKSTSMSMQMTLKLLPSRTEMQRAFYQKDASYNGVFFVAVRTTGIFCRPSCPSCPKPENIEFFFIPCHRVIGKNGQLTGYGGGLWRKRLLLELERTGRLPGTETVSAPSPL